MIELLTGVALVQANAKFLSRQHPRSTVHVYRWEDVPDDAIIRLDQAQETAIDGRPVRLVESYRDEQLLPSE